MVHHTSYVYSSKQNISLLEAIWARQWQNKQNDLCIQGRLLSAWASSQPNQSQRLRSLCALCTQWGLSSAWVFGQWLTEKDLIRFRQIPRLAESSLGPQVILLVLLCCGSITTMSKETGLMTRLKSNSYKAVKNVQNLPKQEAQGCSESFSWKRIKMLAIKGMKLNSEWVLGTTAGSAQRAIWEKKSP